MRRVPGRPGVSPMVVGEMTNWGRLGTVLLVAAVLSSPIVYVLPLATEAKIGLAFAGFGVPVALFGADRVVRDSSDGEDQREPSAPAPEPTPRDVDDTATVEVTGRILGVFMVLVGVGLVAVGALVVLSP